MHGRIICVLPCSCFSLRFSFFTFILFFSLVISNLILIIYYYFLQAIRRTNNPSCSFRIWLIIHTRHIIHTNTSRLFYIHASSRYFRSVSCDTCISARGGMPRAVVSGVKIVPVPGTRYQVEDCSCCCCWSRCACFFLSVSLFLPSSNAVYYYIPILYFSLSLCFLFFYTRNQPEQPREGGRDTAPHEPADKQPVTGQAGVWHRSGPKWAVSEPK